MGTYVFLFQFTPQGMRDFRDSPKRAEATAQAIQKLGGKMTSIVWTMGPYDGLITAELPDDDAATAIALHTCSLGNIRTTTLRAFDREAFAKLIGKLG